MNRWYRQQGNGPDRYSSDGLRSYLDEPITDQQWDLIFRVHQKLIQEIDPAKLQGLDPEAAREAIESAAKRILTQESPPTVGLERDEILSRVADEVLGLGPIEPLINDPTISEVMVNAPEVVYYERAGVIYRSAVQFRDDNHIMRIAERILSPLGRRVDEASPYVDARLQDGSRVNIIIPPVAPKSPTITIRKFMTDKYTVQDLMKGGSFTPELAEYLRACLKGRLNVLISGGAGTGKTTLLNALSAYIPDTERIVTIEDPTELKMQQPHTVTLEARPPSREGTGEVTQRDLFRNSLRMRPDRIIVGEIRGPEAFDMLQAMNTGHEGSLSTVHANSPRDALARVENMVLMSGFDLPVRAIREQMASALHVIIQLARFADGSRKVFSAAEVSGMEGQTITMEEVFRFEHRGFDEKGKAMGEIRPTGLRSRFVERFEMAGVRLPADFFAAAWR